MMTRSLVKALAGFGLLSSLAIAHDDTGRRSLSYTPILPHSRYETDPIDILGSLRTPYDDPLQIARLFIEQLHKGLVSGLDFRIREDSYTDAATGRTYAFATQVVNGFDVLDGVMNVVIQNRRVVAFGDSFYPEKMSNERRNLLGIDSRLDSYSRYCSNVQNQVFREARHAPITSLEEERHVVGDSNCELFPLLESFSTQFSAAETISDPQTAALLFSIVAIPSTSVSQSIARSFDTHLSTLQVELNANAEEYDIQGIPGTTTPVKARLVYVQQPPVGGSVSDSTVTTALTLAWRIVVDFQDNWYEATLDAWDPTVVISVVDWVSDAVVPNHASERGSNTKAGGTPSEARSWKWSNFLSSCFRFTRLLWSLPATTTSSVKVSARLPNPLCIPGKTQYGVWMWGFNNPDSGPRTLECAAGDLMILTPAVADASPWGWHSTLASKIPGVKPPNGTTILNFTTPFGNNVFAQENWNGGFSYLNNFRPNSSSQDSVMAFDYAYTSDTGADEFTDMNTLAGPPVRNPRLFVKVPITQLFYTANMFHDLMYVYGFTEAAGNFQQYNWKKGGIDGDAVIVNAQDGTGHNWANFATPPDGQNGRLRYTWLYDDPYGPWRDGALDNGMVLHELMHGVSGRLVGGSLDSGCLRSGESGGIAEGTSDFIAILAQMTTVLDVTTKSWPFGAWSANNTEGLRKFSYAVSFSTNSVTYASMNDGTYRSVQDIGSVWAQMLFDALAALSVFPNSSTPPLPAYNIAPTLFPTKIPVPPLPLANQLMLTIVLQALKAMPCRPTFLDAQKAVVAAAKNQTMAPGTSLSVDCILWIGFAKRGLGYGATVTGLDPFGQGLRRDSYLLPPECLLPVL